MDEQTPAEGRLAEATVCDTGGCYTSHLLVRGTHIEFVTVDQVRKYSCGSGRGRTSKECRLDPKRLPSDVHLPRSHVLVHDTTGYLLDQCDLYVVRWRGARRNRSEPDGAALSDAEKYFVRLDGSPVPIRTGSVEIPEGPWRKECLVKLIRYRRAGIEVPYEHEYAVPVELKQMSRPLAWRLPLPESCIVDNRGFVRP
jgi:hypothetical protein